MYKVYDTDGVLCAEIGNTTFFKKERLEALGFLVIKTVWDYPVDSVEPVSNPMATHSPFRRYKDTDYYQTP